MFVVYFNHDNLLFRVHECFVSIVESLLRRLPFIFQLLFASFLLALPCLEHLVLPLQIGLSLNHDILMTLFFLRIFLNKTLLGLVSTNNEVAEIPVSVLSQIFMVAL